jgi:hypothetical protein
MAGSDDRGKRSAREAILARRRVFVASAVATLAFGCDKGRPDVCLNMTIPENSQDVEPPTPDPSAAPSEAPSSDEPPPTPSATPSTEPATSSTASATGSSPVPPPPRPPPQKIKRPAPRICLLMVD